MTTPDNECQSFGCDDDATRFYADGKGNELAVCQDHFVKLFHIDQIGSEIWGFQVPTKRPKPEVTVKHTTDDEDEQTGLFGGLFR